MIAVNRDSGTATVFKIAKNSGKLKKQAEIAVGGDPRFVAVAGQNETYAYVTNGEDGTVSVIQLKGADKNTVVATIEGGDMTKDLALLVGPNQKWHTTTGFLEKIDENLNKALAG